MKIIVSTETFQRSIHRALRNKSTMFNIIGNKNEIVFIGTRTIYSYVTPVANQEQCQWAGEFNPVIWLKLQHFIRKLPEQPICIEFNINGEIILSQFVMIF